MEANSPPCRMSNDQEIINTLNKEEKKLKTIRGDVQKVLDNLRKDLPLKDGEEVIIKNKQGKVFKGVVCKISSYQQGYRATIDIFK
jgi:hypothetical protein